jgi:hypothetical protein
MARTIVKHAVKGETFEVDARYQDVRYIGGGAYGSVAAAVDGATGRKVRSTSRSIE